MKECMLSKIVVPFWGKGAVLSGIMSNQSARLKYAFERIHYRLSFLMICLWMLSFHSVAQLTTINVGATTRSMFVYAPSGLQQNRPLVISMHGLNQDINYQKGQAKWELVADTAKFVVVYPAGINNSWDLSGNTDTDFILKIIDAMYTRYGIDRSRVYLSGFSMGGMMTYVAATKIADKIAAFAPVSGYPLGASNFNSSRPIPIIHTHGDADNVVIYDNKLLTYLQGWRTRNGCPSSAVVTKPYPANISNSIATKSYWGTCDCGTEFVLMTLAGKGHWHSNDVTFNTTVEIWKFVRKYTTSCGGTNIPAVTLTAPTTGTVYTEGDNVTVSATATISTGSISKVDFYNGTTLLGTDATSPYTYTITAAAAGNYVITAKATSAANAATTSTAVNIQVAKPIYQTGSAPSIDGTIDALWSNFTSVSIAKNNTGTISSTTDLSGNWKAAWDATNLYVLVQVTDDVKRNDAGTDVYNDDGVEVYIDMGNTKATAYGTNDQQYTFRWNDATAAYEINGHSVTGITKGITNTTTGYIVEVSIPWSTMGGAASVNALEGFEVMINDDDDGAAREGKLAWTATTDDTWSNPGLMGTVILKGLNCTIPTAAITTSTSTTFCAGGSVTLTASIGTGYSYVWKNGTTTITGATTSTYTAATAGSYTVTITNPGGCSSSSAATTVTVNALPTITQYAQIDGGVWNQTAATTVCAGSTVVLGPQPTVATGWAWAGPNSYAATTREITLSGLTANQGGSYTASYTDANGCKASSVHTITVNALPTAAITTTTLTSFCTGGNVVLTASTGSSYKWMNGTTAITGATTQTYTATTAGSYTVEVTNTAGCKATSAATTVTVNALPTAGITTTTPTSFCTGGSVVLTASTGSSYKWMNGTTAITGATAQTYTATTAGSYTVEVTNTAGCKATSAATAVTVNSLPTAAITTTTPTSFCTGGSVVLTASTGSSYKWMNGTTTITGATAQTYTATTAGSYTVEVTNAGNCKATSAATAVTVNTAPTATITANGPTAIPQGGNVTLTANAGSGFTYKWFKGTVQVGTAQSYTATTAGAYKVEVTNSNGCSFTSSATDVIIKTNQPSVITITSPSANTTVQGTITITADVTDADGSIIFVEYLDGNTVIGTSTTAPYSFDWRAPGAGSHVITVRVTDSNGGITTSAPVTIISEAVSTGVQSSNTLNANVYPNPANGIVFIDSDVDLSGADVMLVDVLGNEHILSQTATGLGAQINVSNLSDGAYVLIIKKGNSIMRKKITVIR